MTFKIAVHSFKGGTGKSTIAANLAVSLAREGSHAIKKIDIDFMTDSVVVEYDPTLVTKEEIKERLQNSGYRFVRLAT